MYKKPYAEPWRRAVRSAWAACGIVGPLGGEAFELACRFVIARPKSHRTCHGKGKHLRYDAPVFHTVRPDLDNLVKLIMDTLSVSEDFPEHPWRNDWMIVRIVIEKEWGKRPGCHITISERKRDQ